MAAVTTLTPLTCGGKVSVQNRIRLMGRRVGAGNDRQGTAVFRDGHSPVTVRAAGVRTVSPWGRVQKIAVRRGR